MYAHISIVVNRFRRIYKSWWLSYFIVDHNVIRNDTNIIDHWEYGFENRVCWNEIYGPVIHSTYRTNVKSLSNHKNECMRIIDKHLRNEPNLLVIGRCTLIENLVTTWACTQLKFFFAALSKSNQISSLDIMLGKCSFTSVSSMSSPIPISMDISPHRRRLDSVILPHWFSKVVCTPHIACSISDRNKIWVFQRFHNMLRRQLETDDTFCDIGVDYL